MEQSGANSIGFREVDQDGRPIDPEAASTTGAGPAAPGSQAGSFRVNPFIIILWIVGFGLNAAAVWGFSNAFTSQGPMPGTSGSQLAFFLMNFGPQVAQIGTLTIVCLLFWHALQWQRRRQ